MRIWIKRLLPFVLLGALIGYYFNVEVKQEQSDARNKEQASKLLSVPSEDAIVGLTIVRGDSRCAVSRVENVWQMTAPVSDQADQVIVDGMDKVLRLQNKADVVQEPSKERAVYGLAAPSLFVEVTIKDVAQPKVLSFGEKSPIGDRYFAQWNDSPDVFLVDSNTRGAFDKDVTAMRNKTIVNLDVFDEVVTLEYTIAPYTFKANYNPDKREWRIEQPFPELGITDSIDSIVRSVKGLYVTEFQDGASFDDPLFGLVDPQECIRISSQSGKVVQIDLGSFTPDQKGRYVKVSGRSIPVAVSKEAIDAIKVDPETLIEKRVMIFTPQRISQCDYTKGERTISLTRNGYDWAMDAQPVPPEKIMFVDALLGLLSQVKYTLVLNDEGVQNLKFSDEDKGFGLTLACEGSDAKLTMAFYTKVDGFFIRDTSSNVYYEISGTDYKDIITALDKIQS